MLYYGNQRSDGIVIEPHELVYGDAILNCLTGLLTLPDQEIIIPIDDSPIDFVLLDYYGIGMGAIKLFVMYNEYTIIYHGNCKFIEVTDLGSYRHFCGIEKDGELHIRTQLNNVVWHNYKKDCKQVLSIDAWNDRFNYIYIDHNNKIQGNDDIQTCVILDRFMIIDFHRFLYVYDIEKHILHFNRYLLSDAVYEISETITDMKVYKDNIEIYTTNGNYYLAIEDGKDMLKELPDGWSVKPCFNVRSKSARKID